MEICNHCNEEIKPEELYWADYYGWMPKEAFHHSCIEEMNDQIQEYRSNAESLDEEHYRNWQQHQELHAR